MKKKIFAMLVIIASVIFIAVSTASAEIVYKGSIRGDDSSTVQYYSVDDDTLLILGSGKMAGWLGYAGYGPWVYNDMDAKNNLHTVIIEEGSTNLGSGAFWTCENLETIYFPKSITRIDGCFVDCYNLTDVYYAGTEQEWNQITYWDDRDRKLLASVNIHYNTPVPCGKNLSWSLDDAGTLTIQGTGEMFPFKKDTQSTPWYNRIGEVKRIQIKNGVTDIGIGVFNGCYNLESVNIANSVTSIGAGAFNNCDKLRDIEIPNSVTNIGTGAFNYCHSISEISLPKSITSIGASAFYDCSALKKISIPDKVVEIPQSAFSKCISLENVILPDNIETIDDYAFHECEKLKEIVIPKSLKSLSQDAFYKCNIEKIFLSDLRQWCEMEFPIGWSYSGNTIFTENTKLYINGKYSESLVVPSGTEKINELAFKNYKNFKKIYIPKSVTAFAGLTAENLETIVYEGDKSEWNQLKANNAERLDGYLGYGGIQEFIYNSKVYPPKTIPLQSEPEITLTDETDVELEYELNIEQPYAYSSVYVIMYDLNGHINEVKVVPLELEDGTRVRLTKTNNDASADILIWTDGLQPITVVKHIDL